MRTLLFAIIAALAANTATAQFNIKLPKVKTEKPKTEEARTADPATSETSRQTSGRRVYGPVAPTGAPVLIKDSIYLKATEHDEYWKFPNQRNFSSWVPEIRINLYYNDERPLKYTIAYSNPDGSAWFSQDLDYTGDQLRSPNMYDVLNSKSTNAVGVYSFKITDSESAKVVYQGKFKVGKVSRAYDAVRDKNKFDFFVDYDWVMPFGSVGFDSNDLSKGLNHPFVRVWLKGPIESSELEARVFFNGRQVAASTDGASGNVITTNREFMSNFAPAFAPNNIWKQWQFSWGNFVLENGNPYNKEWYANAHFFDRNPGDYVVKIFRKGVQIREISFAVGADGRFVVPAYASQVPIPNYSFITPVKVLDPSEKWNINSWKTDAFFANPVSGFSVP